MHNQSNKLVGSCMSGTSCSRKPWCSRKLATQTTKYWPLMLPPRVPAKDNSANTNATDHFSIQTYSLPTTEAIHYNCTCMFIVMLYLWLRTVSALDKGVFQRRCVFPLHSIPDSFQTQLYNCAVQFTGYQASYACATIALPWFFFNFLHMVLWLYMCDVCVPICTCTLIWETLIVLAKLNHSWEC